MKTKSHRQLFFSVIIAIMMLLAACSPQATITETPTPTSIPPTETPIPPTETALPTETSTSTPTATPIPTLIPSATPSPSNFNALAGVWSGTVTGQGESTNIATEEKIFEIRVDCNDSPVCLDVLQANFFNFMALPLDQNGSSEAPCFNFSAAPFILYSACFTLLPDGTLDYSGSGPLWGESGVLQPMDSQSATELKTRLNSSCKGLLESQLKNGVQARVAFTDGKPLNLRSEMGVQGNKVLSIPEGELLSVLSGPLCADGYWWWYVDYKGSLGYVAEGTNEEYFIEPLSP